jgi:transposase
MRKLLILANMASIEKNKSKSSDNSRKKNKKELGQGEHKKRYDLLLPALNEKQRRVLVASDVLTHGLTISDASRYSGLSRKTIYKSLGEIKNGNVVSERIREVGGGRKKKLNQDSRIRVELEKLLEPTTRGEPTSSLRWTTKSLRNLSDAMKAKGFDIGKNIVASLLRDLGFSLQSNRKVNEGKKDHPDRDKQFHYINKLSTKKISQNEPVISVATKKKELIGKYKNAAREWKRKGKPEEVLSHDFIDHDTSEFAVESIRRWWKELGKKIYENSKSLTIFADSGGSNGNRVRLWKACLQEFAYEIKKEIIVCHFPSGTSKWNKIEHRLSSYITKSWRGRPLVDDQIVVSHIGSTKTKKGLKVKAKLDKRKYTVGIKVSDEIFDSLNLKPHRFHPEWNYSILPI